MRRLTSRVVKRVGRMGSRRVTCSHESPSSSTSHSSLARGRDGEWEGGSAGGEGEEKVTHATWGQSELPS